jgi:hypothetical protein
MVVFKTSGFVFRTGFPSRIMYSASGLSKTSLRICHTLYRQSYVRNAPITVTARSKARTVFAPSYAGIVGSNPTRGMDVCVHLFCVCVVLCVGRGLATS